METTINNQKSKGELGSFGNSFKSGCHAVAAWSLATLITVLMTTAASGAFIGGRISIVNTKPSLG